ncbi:cysteine methyltransferase [Nanoarchaeota archaeon]|nr:MAG: cysteine methyltransferase [Nanoarchaeota archaeon]
MRLEELVRKIPEGRVTTYKELARVLGTSPRVVGQLLKRSKGIPCHRVVRSDGSLGGYRGKKWREKKRLLEREGIKIKGKLIVDFEKVMFKLSSR